MIRKLLLPAVASLALAAMLGGCTQKNTADEPAPSGIPAGLERFLLFPNPIAQATGGFETDTSAYAEAYYHAIDPANAKDTIDKWKTANNFGTGTGTEHLAVFRDTKDLGYGRRMTGRINTATDGSVAFFVENYNVTNLSGGGYDGFNVDAAVARDTRWHVGTNAIEWSTTTCIAGEDAANCVGNSNNVKFAKFYNFSSTDGTRQLAVDLDGKGKKAMPGPCITCHGGRGDPLTPADVSTGKQRFPLVENSLSRKRGDVQAKLHGMNVDSFGYSSQSGFTKADQQAFLKDFNQWILCTYPAPGGGNVTGGWGTCARPVAGANEWQGTAGPMIEAWYGGNGSNGMPQATFLDNYVPAGWSGNPSLYTGVVAPFCRTCHILRGTANQNDIDFMALGTPAVGVTPATGFQSYADRIKSHVFDRGTMPLAMIVYDDFWRSSAPNTLAAYIDSVLGPGTATSASGGALTPGRPIADAGPNRMVKTNANAILTAENSLFASTFNWTLLSGSGTITNPSSMIAIFKPGAAGDHVVRLTVGNGAGGDSKDVTITADDSFPDPLNIKFANVKNVLQNIQHTTSQTSGKCTSCHVSPAVSPTPPIFYNSNFDRDGSGIVDATDEAWFLKAIQGRVNLTEITASPLLRKPTGNHHKGLMLLDVTDTTVNGGLRNYSILYNWVLAGMQPGGVAASALVNGGAIIPPLTFSGTPPLATGIALDGSGSVGATNFLWSVSGPSGPSGTLPSVSNPTSASGATLNLPFVGSYVVQLDVNDGVSSDTAQQTITVTETPVVADFIPAQGNATVTFSGSPLRANINLTSTSSGSPTTCLWEVTGPAGATLDGASVPATNPPATSSKFCGTSAVLNVSSSSVGLTYSVKLTPTSSLGTIGTPATHNLTVQSAGSGVVANAGANSTNTLTFTNPLSSTPNGGVAAPDQAGIPVAPAISLNGSASTGPGTLTYAWSIISAPGNATGSYAASIASPSSVSTTLTVHRTGAYTVQLFVSNGLPPGPSNTATRTITVNANAITFTTMKGRLNNSLGCASCHVSNSVTPPSWIDQTVGGLTLYQRVLARVNATDPAQSFMVRCPARGDCGMGQQGGFTNANSTNYTEFLNWIISGAPNN